jgi:hypothetical protein
MPAPRTDAKKESDRLAISQMVLQGFPMQKIAKTLSISTETLYSDLREIEAQWRREQVDNIAERKAIELEKLRHIEEQLWIAWEQSKKKYVIVQGEAVEVPHHGDTSVMDKLLKVREQTCKLLGLFSDLTINNDGQAVIVVPNMSRMQNLENIENE